MLIQDCDVEGECDAYGDDDGEATVHGKEAELIQPCGEGSNTKDEVGRTGVEGISEDSRV